MYAAVSAGAVTVPTHRPEGCPSGTERADDGHGHGHEEAAGKADGGTEYEDAAHPCAAVPRVGEQAAPLAAVQPEQEGRHDDSAHQQHGEELVGQLADVGLHDGRRVAAVSGDDFGQAFREFGVRFRIRHEQGPQAERSNSQDLWMRR